MTHKHEDTTDDYLWDPTGPAAPAVRTIEDHLRPLRFDPALRPLRVTSQRSGWRRTTLSLMAAAAVLLITGAGLWQWRFAWPEGRPWNVTGTTASTQLHVGLTLQLPESEQARVDVARIGNMEVTGGTDVMLQATSGSRHRLSMNRGQVRFRLWAPPGSVAIETPAGEIVDMGCEFDLHVVGDTSRVQVRSGWVLMANAVGETLIPAGASSAMRSGQQPGAPVFDDAASDFRAAVRRYEAAQDEASLRAVIAGARSEDVLTLLVLLERRPSGAERLADRAAELSAPPREVTLSGAIRGDTGVLWAWRESLPLPPPKNWLRNWTDALPHWR